MKKGLVFASIFFFVIPSFSMKRRLTLANIDTKRKLQKTENITSDFDDVSSSSSDDYMDFDFGCPSFSNILNNAQTIYSVLLKASNPQAADLLDLLSSSNKKRKKE